METGLMDLEKKTSLLFETDRTALFIEVVIFKISFIHSTIGYITQSKIINYHALTSLNNHHVFQIKCHKFTTDYKNLPIKMTTIFVQMYFLFTLKNH